MIGIPWIADFDHQPDFHDFHHCRFSCNYGNIGWLDALHGTSKMYFDMQQQAELALSAGGVGGGARSHPKG